MWPSLVIALPTLLVGLAVNITFALFLALFRATYFDVFGVVICVIIMSISSLFYVIMGQYIFGKVLRLVPLSGYQNGIDAIKFLILPILIGVFSGISAGTVGTEPFFSKSYTRIMCEPLVLKDYRNSKCYTNIF